LQNKENWAYVKGDRTVYCVEKSCKFSTNMAADCLVEHCKTKHDWRKRRCTYAYCNFEAYN